MRLAVRALIAIPLFLSSAVPAAGQADGAAIADIREYLGRLEKLGFAGAVAIAQAGETLLAEGYGLADRERDAAWGPETVSTVGSITKQFTGAAILSLEEEGLLSVDDPITEHFPDVPEDKREITLHHLLTHSSGIVDLRGFGDWDPIGREAFVRRALAQDLQFDPGTSYAYSNAGYSLLGAIVEQLTGMSWEAYVRERFWLPAGMTDTGYILADWDEDRLAQGYTGEDRWGTVLGRPMAEDGPYWVLRANGGVHSTALDMLRWGQALLDGGPLSPESMEAYWSPYVDEGGGDSFYGYGWVVLDMGGRTVITHNGGNGILFADMAIVPDAETVIVLQTNVVADFQGAQQLLERLGTRLLFGRDLPPVPDRAETAPADLGRRAGLYDLVGGGVLRASVDGDELAVEPRDRDAFRALLSTRPVDVDRARRLSDRIDALVRAYLADDWSPLWEAYGRPGEYGPWASGARASFAALAEANGPLRGHEILGTAFRDGRDVTLVRLAFEHGEEYRAYVWDPDAEERLLGTSRRGLDHVIHVLPEEGGSWATWDGRTGGSRPVRFDTTADGRPRMRIGDLEALKRPGPPPGLPGGETVDAGLADLAAGRVTRRPVFAPGSGSSGRPSRTG